MPKVYVESYGCSSSLADKEIALGILKNKGFDFSEDPKNSDLNIIFTCCVKVPTINRMISRIKYLTSLRKTLIVAGCLPKAMKDLVEKISPEASLISPDWVGEIGEVAAKSLENKRVVLLEDVKKSKLSLPRCRENPIIAIVQIGRGCTSNCSFCCEPYRGKLFSYPLEEIVKEVERSVREGCKEIWITSLDTGCYGLDIGTSLPELLEKICNLDGNFFVRVGMANPYHVKRILKNLLDSYKSEKIFKFLHIPLQTASDRLLKLMNRGYTYKEFLKIVKAFRKVFPEITIATDIIVGLPTESEKDFRKTVEFVKKVKPDVVNLSKFGLHPGTQAAKMEQVDKNVVKERSKKLFEVVREVQLQTNRKWIGWEGYVLIDEKGKNGTWVGRNFAYKPIVIKGEGNLLGNLVKIKVESVKSNYLIGKALNLNIGST
jgi:MiaB-like tRNA modifying enzyme